MASSDYALKYEDLKRYFERIASAPPAPVREPMIIVHPNDLPWWKETVPQAGP